MLSLSFRLGTVKLNKTLKALFLLALSDCLIVISRTESTVSIVSSSSAVLSQLNWFIVLINATVNTFPAPILHRYFHCFLFFMGFWPVDKDVELFSFDALDFHPIGLSSELSGFMHAIAQFSLWHPKDPHISDLDCI